MQSISTNASVGLRNKDYCRLSQASVLLYQRRPLANDSELVCLRVINRFVLEFQVTQQELVVDLKLLLASYAIVQRQKAGYKVTIQEAQLSPRDRAMRRVN